MVGTANTIRAITRLAMREVTVGVIPAPALIPQRDVRSGSFGVGFATCVFMDVS